MDTKSDTNASHRPGRGRVFDSIVDTVGDTPIVRLRRLPQQHGVNATILAKLEYFNPAASVKDRIGAAMIIAMEKAGKIHADTVLIEPTSGNTGIALAFVAASRGYRLKLVMPESVSTERCKMLAFLGAEIVLTSAAQGMKGSIAMAEELVRTTPHAVMPQQFKNLANPGDPPTHHGRGNLERYRRKRRLCRGGCRYRRYHHGDRSGPEAAQAGPADRCGGAGREPGLVGRPAFAAQEFKGSARVLFLTSWIVRLSTRSLRSTAPPHWKPPAHSRAAKASRAAFRPAPRSPPRLPSASGLKAQAGRSLPSSRRFRNAISRRRCSREFDWHRQPTTSGDEAMAEPPRRPRTLNDARTEAEAAFKQVTKKVAEAPPKTTALPGIKELVSLRIDQDVLEYFQKGGPGWQDRINAALRKAAGVR